MAVLNSCFLYFDVAERPYRVEDFRPSLDEVGVLKVTESLGPYQMNHLWLKTLKTAEAKRRLLAAGELSVKGKKCYVLDPNRAEVILKIHWVSHHVPDTSLRDALQGFGRIEGVTRDVWHVDGFEGIEQTTSIIRTTLNNGVTLESLPHQLQLKCHGYVVVPGRPPVYLRCRRARHVRKNCDVPKCESCHHFGQKKEDCARTYATATAGPADFPGNDMLMDKAEAEAASQSVTSEVGGTSASPSEQASTLEPAREGHDEIASVADTSEHTEEEVPASSESEKAHEVDAAAPEAPGNAPVVPEAQRVINENELSGAAANKKGKTKKQPRSRTSSKASQDLMDAADQASEAAKRTLGLVATPRCYPLAKGLSRRGNSAP